MSDAEANLFVIAAPSGAGKTTLVKALVTRNPELRFSISYTTRPKRRNEAHGVDYLFVDKDEFDALRHGGALLESAEVFDNHYGTSRIQVDAHLKAGHGVVLEIDWQGARQVRASMPECVSIFILPPSHEELVRRLRERRTDSDEVIARRLRDAVSDMSHWDEFDYVVINDDLDQAVADLEAVLAGRGDAQATSNPDLRRAVSEIVS
ncbi:MAG: guanylate kinase [Gammaproteobacteria bacterium]|nr:guanylate kinase [Gammaproteobacteria bacterium]MDH3430301.1 guanylate kinase [Gammaproteobacteria bacterium]MDH3433372.1 guanylate kinase [Gammaproteobacteria bacterium]